MLHRRACVGEHLPTFRSTAIGKVTGQRDLGFLGLSVVLRSWSDHSWPMAFIQRSQRGLLSIHGCRPSHRQRTMNISGYPPWK